MKKGDKKRAAKPTRSAQTTAVFTPPIPYPKAMALHTGLSRLEKQDNEAGVH